jgi:fatty acid desaturase
VTSSNEFIPGRHGDVRGATAPSPLIATAPPLDNRDYLELRRLVQQRGLLERQPAYYTYKILLTLGLVAISLLILVLVDNPWLQLLNAVFLGFVSTQVGLVGHDLGHKQVFRSARLNLVFGLLFGNLLVGVSRQWWIDKHNQHHSHPNEMDLDPDIAIPFLAFSEEQARAQRGLPRFIVTYQAFFILPMMLLQAVALHYESIRFVLRGRVKHRLAEMLTLLGHFALFFGLPFLVLDTWLAVLFIITYQVSFGLYMSSIFAPNHKGMPVLDETSKLNFLHQQVLTARNVHSHPITDFWYGGLNYQIEHHLFPTMPRNRLREAQPIIRAFCAARGIAFHETSVPRSYWEIAQYLHEVSAPLRARG